MEAPKELDLKLGLLKRARHRNRAIFFGVCLAVVVTALAAGLELGVSSISLAVLLFVWHMYLYWLHEPERYRRHIERLSPECSFTVLHDSDGVQLTHPDGTVERLLWDALFEVYILTTSGGPLACDVFFVLKSDSGQLNVPQGATGHLEFLERLGQLPGWRDEQVIKAMGCTNDSTFTCWQRAA